jgi:DNA-binding transcriptional MocR family regulator
VSALDSALNEHGVAYMPGQAFSPRQGAIARRSVRLNFSHPTIEQIGNGIRSLGQVFRSLAYELPVSCAG